MDKKLEHFGVKGMKWGVHKKYIQSYMKKDRVFKKNFEFQNISSNIKRDLSRNTPVFAAYRDIDKNAYAGYYAKHITEYGNKAIKNTILVKKDIKIPSQKKSVDLFMKLLNNDKKNMSDSIGKAYAELTWFNKISSIRNFNSNRISKKFQSKGENWLQNKGYLLFNQSMMSTDETKARNYYFKLLMKHGYSGINDINDAQNKYAEEPVILINPKQTLKNVKSVELSMREIELANAKYLHQSYLKDKGISKLLNYNDYKENKKHIKKLEKKYNEKIL